MMKTGADGAVTLDLNGPAFEEVLQRHKFSRHGQIKGSPMMNAELDKLKDFFGDPADGAKRCQEAGRILNSIMTVPSSQAARALLKKSMNIQDADFDDPAKAGEIVGKTRQAVMKAMCTPVTQEEVGSCFATAPLRKMRDDNPIKVMEMYTEIAKTGIFTAANSDKIPAVLNRAA